ncbi:MAG: hypothetical protein R3C59_11725 [Planctomycetaceae bacterium]
MICLKCGGRVIRFIVGRIKGGCERLSSRQVPWFTIESSGAASDSLKGFCNGRRIALVTSSPIGAQPVTCLDYKILAVRVSSSSLSLKYSSLPPINSKKV